MPDEPEVRGLLALMLLHHSRRDARLDEHGELVLLADQDRGRWHAEEQREGTALATGLRGDGPYALQAAIAAEHASGATEPARVAELYGRLAALDPSPVVQLNRAVAVATADGPEAGLELIADLEGGRLDGYHLLHAARADLLRRLGRDDEAAAAYRRAHELAANPAERAFLARRLGELSA
jgi:RNA polymerase sigma-70 factor (ECF subfamily)